MKLDAYQSDTTTTAPPIAQAAPPLWFSRLPDKEHAVFSRAFTAMEQEVALAQRDGLSQLVPMILIRQQSVRALRRSFGKAQWRRVHHASEMTNFMRALIWLKYREEATWEAILQVPQMHLRSCRNTFDWPIAHYASRRAAEGKFSHSVMLYRDTLRMGVTPNPDWSLKRLKREHDALAMKLALADSCPTPWAASFEVTFDNLTFTRLVSDRDFTLEARGQRHCIASYLDSARRSECIVMRCTGDERATFRFRGPEGQELRSYANGPVSPRMRFAAEAARVAFELHETAQTG